MWTSGLLTLLLSQALAAYIPSDGSHTSSYSLSDIVTLVNSNPSATWTAGHNFHPELPASYLKSLVGTLDFDPEREEHREFIHQVEKNRATFAARSDSEESGEDTLETMGCKKSKGLPRNFDARKKWPHCPSIGHIVDQSNCGSCWAVSVASAISDRLCIASNGFFQGLISGQQLMSCTKRSHGCEGGWPTEAWKHWGHEGVVTGGDYKSQQGCQPYTLPPCEHHTQGSLPNCTAIGVLKTPKCESECWNKDYGVSYKHDLLNGKKAHVVPRCNVMRQIYEHGPVVAIFSVYEDFLQYKSGIYQHMYGNTVGLHAVRVIGWGVEGDTAYWLVTNSWNDHWGDHGTFKILRGENEADFEVRINAGYPRFLQI